MRFNKKRADAFVEYTMTALLKEAESREEIFVMFRRKELADVLGQSKLHDTHVDYLREVAIAEDIGVANMGNRIFFFNADTAESVAAVTSPLDAGPITDEFERVYGSDAADEMWERQGYRPMHPNDAPKRRPARGETSLRSIKLRG